MDMTKDTLNALIAAIMTVDINPGYQASKEDYAKLKAAKLKAMELKAMISVEEITDEELAATAPLLRGYRVADINKAIAKYNASQTDYVVRSVKPGDEKILSSAAPSSWTTAGLNRFREMYNLRRPDEDDYEPLK